MQEAAVGFEVYDAPGTEESGIAFEEERGTEPCIFAAHLRVGEGKPDFIHLSRGEKCIDQFDACPQESYVSQVMGFSVFCSLPKPCTLDVNADIVPRRITLRQGNGVFALAATEFQHDGARRIEHLSVPASLYLMVA